MSHILGIIFIGLLLVLLISWFKHRGSKAITLTHHLLASGSIRKSQEHWTLR